MVQGAVKAEARPVTRPNSLIFTLYGDFVGGGTLGIGRLVRLMAEFGLSSQAVRQAVSRMSRQGWLTPSKQGNRAYYGLTDAGKQRVAAVAPRIYEPAREWDGRWRLLTYTIPENNRQRRDRLRKDLTLLGLAPLSSSAWISPHEIGGQLRELAQAHEVLEHVDFFTADYTGPRSDRELLERCWNLPAIAAAYREFIAAYEPRLATERANRTLTDESAFVERLWLVQDFRRFVYLDPGLPGALLTPHWPGTVASALFREYYASISGKAQRFYEAAT